MTNEALELLGKLHSLKWFELSFELFLENDYASIVSKNVGGKPSAVMIKENGCEAISASVLDNMVRHAERIGMKSQRTLAEEAGYRASAARSVCTDKNVEMRIGASTYVKLDDTYFCVDGDDNEIVTVATVLQRLMDFRQHVWLIQAY